MTEFPLAPSQVYRELSERFDRVAADRPVDSFDIALGTAAIRVRTVGTASRALLDARWGHLQIDRPRSIDGTIDVYESDQPIGARPGADLRWGHLIGDRGLFVHDWRGASDAALDLRGRRIVARFPREADLTDDEAAKPLHRLIGALLGDTTAMVHAASVGLGDRAVLLAGPGGSGKSTTALVCRSAGMTFLGDDYVGVTTTVAGVLGHSLYASAMVAGGGSSGAPRSAAKALVMVRSARPQARIVGILLPRIGAGRGTTLTAASAGDFVRAAAPYSLVANAQDRGAAMGIMASVGAKLPIWRCALGSDPEQVVAAVRGTLAE